MQVPNKIACIAVVKNAALHIAEWIAFQFAVGFDAVVLLDNGSTDGTRAVAARFAGKFDVRVIDWPMTSSDYQRRGYEYALRACRDEFAWCACIDADEFLVLPRGRTLADLVDVPGDVAAIALPWALFGSSGHVKRPTGLVVEAYLQRGFADFNLNKHIKSLVRPSKVIACLTCHHFSVDGAYADMRHDRVDQHYALRHSPDFAYGKLHHYFVQSQEDWEMKMRRGYHDTTRSRDEFDVHDRNEERDEGALRYVPLVKVILDNLPSEAVSAERDGTAQPDDDADDRTNGRAGGGHVRLEEPRSQTDGEVMLTPDVKKSVGLCVIFNHPPMEGHIAVLREIYRSRFSQLRFLVPMTRSNDPDIITVYRGSYTHNAYFSDCLAQLQTMDCSHYLITHDDVLLAPHLNETNIADRLQIGPDDGYIPWFAPTERNIGDWGHWTGSLWRLMHCRNHLSGTGAQDLKTVLAQLPPLSSIRGKFAPMGVPAHTTFELTEDTLDRGGALKRFQNFGGGGDDVAFMRAYLDNLFAAGEGGRTLTVPYPFVYAGFGGDFVVVPKSAAADFAHYSGVLATAGIFAEISHPTALILACDKVVRSPDPFGEYDWVVPLHDPFDILPRMESDRPLIAAHPIKLSHVKDWSALIRACRALEATDGRAPLPRERRDWQYPAFDKDIYYRANPDVVRHGVDAHAHYLAHGWLEGRPFPQR